VIDRCCRLGDEGLTECLETCTYTDAEERSALTRVLQGCHATSQHRRVTCIRIGHHRTELDAVRFSRH
jgi:hypothetical protein